MNKRVGHEKEIESKLNTITTEVKDGVFVFSGPMSIGEFAHAIKKPATEIITRFFKEGKMFTINQVLDEEQIAELCLEYGFDFNRETEFNAQNVLEELEIKDDPKDLMPRAPIITIMGHVDHGKTTLIDFIRKSDVVASEAGGITQHTGAYQVIHNNKSITFLDTPGHKAFTLMRVRGAKVTDIVILVVAADDGVMPQTKEAIDHAKAAKVPIIVFINKMDKQGANPEKIKGDLSTLDVVAEDWGGDTQFIEGSALSGKGVAELFDAINVLSEVMELKANPNRLPVGTVIEAHLDKGKGAVAVVIVEHGTLFSKDFIVAGSNFGRIRTIEDTNGQIIEKVIPGMPATITGLSYVPNAGDRFFGFHDEKFAKKLAGQKEFADKQSILRERSSVQVEEGIKIINLIIKSDVQGTTEAIKASLAGLENDEAKVNIIRSSVGALTESDVLLAQSSNAIIYGFNIKPSVEIRNLVKDTKVDLRLHNVIYRMVEEVEGMLLGLKTPKYEEKFIGEASVLKTFFYSKVGTIAGCLVQSGVIKANCSIKVQRGDKIIFEGKLATLQHGKDQVKIVEKGKEFGCNIKNFNDIKEFDLIKAYEVVEVK